MHRFDRASTWALPIFPTRRATTMDEALATTIVREAYMFAYPLVLMDMTRRVRSTDPTNAFTHFRAFPPGDFRDVVRPNFDTLYSFAWLDVSEEPMVVSVPDTGGRYYMLPMLDMYSDVFAVIGSRTTGTGAGHYAVVEAGWAGSLPDGATRIEAPTAGVWVIGRIQTNGVADYETVHQIQDALEVTPLSVWPAPPSSPVADVDETIDRTVGPADQVAAMTGAEFFEYAARLLQSNPPHLIDQPMVARMRRVGIEPGERLDADALDPVVRAAIDAAPAVCLEEMEAAVRNAAPLRNGWAFMRSNIGVYGTNYRFRAGIALVGLGANLPEDAIYPLVYLDADGEPPTGDKDYVLHFDAADLPPVDAFWSVTMYDGEGFTVPNALDRYALGDRDPLRYNDDGSLDLYLQHESPGDELASNWLPAPRGPIGVTMRLYAPRSEVLDGTWSPPPLTPR